MTTTNGRRRGCSASGTAHGALVARRSEHDGVVLETGDGRIARWPTG